MEDLARESGAAMVFPYYTPAPDKQYPFQFEQTYEVLEYIVRKGRHRHNLLTESVILAGDSAGGVYRPRRCPKPSLTEMDRALRHCVDADGSRTRPPRQDPTTHPLQPRYVNEHEDEILRDLQERPVPDCRYDGLVHRRLHPQRVRSRERTHLSVAVRA